MFCTRCGCSIHQPEDSLRLWGAPAAGLAGPRVIETVTCPECSRLLALFLAGGNADPPPIGPAAPTADLRPAPLDLVTMCE